MLKQNLILKVKKLSDKAKVPAYATEGSAGLDITAIDSKIIIESGSAFIEYKTGISLEIPSGFTALLFPRSSISKTNLMMANGVGVIDSDFRGEITVRFKTVGTGKAYKIGDKIAQLIIMPLPSIICEEVNTTTSTNRESGSYGSTGN